MVSLGLGPPPPLVAEAWTFDPEPLRSLSPIEALGLGPLGTGGPAEVELISGSAPGSLDDGSMES